MPPPAQRNQDDHQDNEPSDGALPGSLDRTIDLDLEGRRRHPLIRRGILALFVLIALAALSGFFGQRPERSTAAGDGTTVTLEAPYRLRSGLIFAARLDIVAGRRGIAEPRIELSRGWLDHVTNNSLRPEPTSQTSPNGRLRLAYPSVDPRETLTLWTQWQVNPTTAGRVDGDVSVYDGDRLLANVDRTITIFP